MIGLVMSGGKGSRMNIPSEKLLLIYKKPVILHVFDAIKDSQCFEKFFAVTSPNSPMTKELLVKSGIHIIETSGIGYVEDLNHVLSLLNDLVFVTSGDLPLLDGEIIKTIISMCGPHNKWTSILVTKEFLESLNLSSDLSVEYNKKLCHYTGISLINSRIIKDMRSIQESFVILDDKRIAFNLNTIKDYELLGAS